MEHRFRDFLKALGARWFTAMSGPLSVPLAIAALYVPSEAAKAGLGVTAIVSAIFSSYWIWRVERQKFEVEHNKVIDFESERRSPRLDILFDRSDPCEQFRPPDRASHTLHEYSIEIKSKWHESLRDCYVEIDQIEPPVNNFVPLRLRQSTDMVSQVVPRAHQQTFELGPFGRIHIDVAELDEREPTMQIQLAYAYRDPSFSHAVTCVPRGSYVLTIKAFAHIGPPAEARFALSAESHGCLQFRKL